MKQIDILAIGDIATDAFIKIKDAEAVCDTNGDHCKLCLTYAGKIPYESVEVCNATGNSSNAAISFSRLGLSSALMSNIGDDQYGSDCIEILQKENVDTNFIKKEVGKKTNYHYVLCYDKERTILVKHEKYNYEWTNESIFKDYHSPSWIYLSSLGEDSLSFHNEIMMYLERHPNVKLAFQPGTFQIKLGYNELKNIYSRADLFLCNKEEAEKILNTDEKEISNLLKMIYDLGPKIVVITDSLNGAYSYDGKDIFFMKALPQNPIETTGAGDSFSSSFLASLFLGNPIPTCLIWGALNAMSVVSYVGPQKGLLTKEKIERATLHIEEDFKPIKIN
jgi:sugar/nucleoside kinase (ribokinase family)